MTDLSLAERPVLLTGMGGVLGAGLAAGGLAERLGSCVIAGRHVPAAWAGTPFIGMDLAQPGVFEPVFAELQPRAVVHAAALARLDECEDQPELADRLNHQLSREVGLACQRAGIPWVFLSTDQVFDGRAEGYDERASPTPLHVYGRTKAEGEAAALAHDGMVARLPLLLGPPVPGAIHKRGADAAVVEAALGGSSWTLFDDEWRVPIDPALLTAEVAKVCARKPRAMVLHWVGGEAVSRFTLGQRACAAAGVSFSHKAGTGQAVAGPPRPPRLLLTTEQTHRELGFKAPDLRQSLARAAAIYRPNPEERVH